MRRPCNPLRCERLEDRTTPTVFTVDTPFDVVDPNDGLTSLREAIALANADTDALSTAVSFSEDLKQKDIFLNQIGGTTYGPTALEITRTMGLGGNGNRIIRADGAPKFRFFSVAPGVEFSIGNAELINGVAPLGGAIYSAGTLYFGGGISGCISEGSPATGGIGYGGAIYTEGGGRLTIAATTLTGNIARGGVAGGHGGAVFASGVNVVFQDDTIADNVGRNEVELYGTPSAPPSLFIHNSIIARSGPGPMGSGDDANLVIHGYFTGAPWIPGGQEWGHYNLIRSNSGFLGEIYSTADPLLGPLQDNGGHPSYSPVRTRALLPGSPAIDPVGQHTRGPAPDVRGMFFGGSSMDIGPYEYSQNDWPVYDDGNLFPSKWWEGQPPTTPAALDNPPGPTPEVAIGAAAGQSPEVRVLNPDGTERKRFLAYAPDFLGGVQVALWDMTGDGVNDVITAAGAGGGPHVKVFDGVTFEEVRSFFAFDPGFHGGLSLAVGFLTGDGKPAIVVGAGPGGGPHVKVFDGLTGAEVKSFFALDPNFAGGVNVAFRYTDIVVGTGAGGAPHVKVFDSHTLAEKYDFLAYDADFRGGVNVATKGGGYQTPIITGTGPGGPPQVKIFDLWNLRWRNGYDPEYVEVSHFFAGEETDTNGVRVSSGPYSDSPTVTQTSPGGPTRQHRWIYNLWTSSYTVESRDLPGDFGSGTVATTLNRLADAKV